MLQYLRLLHRGIRRTMISACLPRSIQNRFPRPPTPFVKELEQSFLSRSWSDALPPLARA